MMSNVAKFHGAEKTINFYGKSRFKAYQAGLKYLAALGVDEDAYNSYDGSDADTELEAMDEILRLYRRNGFETVGNGAPVREIIESGRRSPQYTPVEKLAKGSQESENEGSDCGCT